MQTHTASFWYTVHRLELLEIVSQTLFTVLRCAEESL